MIRILIDHRTPESACLACGASLSAAAGMPGEIAKPTEGSVSICVTCGHVMLFRADLKLRDLTPEELAEVHADERVAEALAAITKGRPRQ